MAANFCTAGGGRLQKSRSSRWGQDRQLSMISRPYGARISSPPRSIPPSLRDTKRNPLGICIRPLNDNELVYFYWNEGSLAVMAITLPCDEGYSSPFRLSAYLDLS